jgi:hypothetical protein
MSDAAGSTGGAPSAPTSAAPVAAQATGGPGPANTNGSAREPAANDQSGAPPDEPRYKLKLKTGEQEFPLSEILKRAQKGEGAEERFREAAAKEREIERLLQKLPEDTIGALEHLVGDKSKAAQALLKQLWTGSRSELEAFLVEQYEYESKPEPERRKVDEHRDLQAKAKRLEEIESREKDRAHTQAVEQHQQRFAQQFTAALSAAGVDMSDPEEAEEAMSRMAMHVERAIDSREQTNVQAIATKVAARLEKIATGRVRRLAKTPERLAELLGDEGRGALRKWDVDSLKPKAPMPERMPGNGKARAEKPAGERKRVGTSDFFRKLRGEG